jgi:hypothetical protein
MAVTETAETREQVDDPVGHISISGIHGRDELDERLASAPVYDAQRKSPIGFLLLGAAIGVALTYLVKR